MSDLTTRILDLARRVRCNLPRHSDPEEFHAEKSEIARGLEDIATELRPTQVKQSDHGASA